MLRLCLRRVLCLVVPLCVAEANVTVVFDGSEHADRLRNCSCATAVPSCDRALARLVCSCGTVRRSDLSPATLEAESLTVWAWQPWILTELLNGCRVPELHLSLCSPALRLGPGQHLTIVGLRKLRIGDAATAKRNSERVLDFALDENNVGVSVAFLDLWSSSDGLKAYSVIGPPLRMLMQRFPDLQQANRKITDLQETHRPSILTFIY